MTAAVYTLTAASRRYALKAVESAPDGWRVRLEQPKRSPGQNARMWAMLGRIAISKEWCGEWLTADEWKHLFTAAWRKERAIPGLHGGVVMMPARTSQMSKEELSELMELISAWCVENDVEID